MIVRQNKKAKQITLCYVNETYLNHNDAESLNVKECKKIYMT